MSVVIANVLSSGVSVAAAWALGGIALDKRSEKHVRAIAGVAAAGVLADLAFKAFTNKRGQKALSDTDVSQGEDEIDTDQDYALLVEDTFIAPNVVIEEITAFPI